MGAVWVISGPGLPCGGRVLGDSGDGRVWVDVCMMGQHLPQMYSPAETRPLDAAGCARLGLCPDCLGFGDLDPGLAAGLGEAARALDQVDRPCPGCGGTGRPALRVTLSRSAGSIAGDIRPVPHPYVPPLPAAQLPDVAVTLAELNNLPADWCLGCGLSQDGAGPRGEPLHVPA